MLSDAVVNYFLADLNIELHFVALRRYLLLQDGEYAQSLTDQLFNKVCIILSLTLTTRPVSRSRFSPTPADSVLSHRQPTHIG